MADTMAILVLGMHRSGTSAVTGCLQALGVDLGPYLMAADPTQPKGYFEHAEIVGIHDDLMAAFDSSWDDPRSLPEGWERDPRVRPFRAQLMEIIRRDFISKPLWGAKDPRLCRLLPLWLTMLGELSVPVRAICVLRHPTEVAASLALRNGFSAEKSGLLWLRYALEAERHSRCVPRVTLRYNDLLRDWRTNLQHVAHCLGIEWPEPYDDAAPALSAFLERALRHHLGLYFECFPPPLRKWIVSAYRALKQRDCPSEDGRRILDSVHRELAPYDSYVSACWLEQVRNIRLENAQRRAQIAQFRSQLEQNQKRTSDELVRQESALALAKAELALAQSDVAAARLKLEEEVVRVAHTESQLTQARSELGTARAELEQEIAGIRAELERAGAELTQARSELEGSRADFRRARQELDAVYRSRYWRLTRPWRTLDTYLRNRRRRRREKRRGK
jgi:hypothetical protein